MCHDLALDMWLLLSRCRLYLAGLEALSAKKCGGLGFFIRDSTVRHTKAKNALFSGPNHWERGVVRSYYQRRAYADRRKETRVTKMYGEKYVEVTA